MQKRNLLQDTLYFIAALLLFVAARLIFITCKKEIIRSRELEDCEAANRPIIYALWHGRIFPMGFAKPGFRKIYTVVSRHGDGQLISYVLMLMGSKVIRGSTNRKSGDHKKGFPAKNRGGAYVIRRSIGVLEEGGSLAITPDGPKGPRFVFKPNSVKIASEASAPIVPVSFSCSNAKVFKSWDRFILPKPFSKIKIRYGNPKFIPQNVSIEEAERYSKELQDELNNITQELDKEFGIDLN